MKTKRLFSLILLSFSFYLLSSQVPQGFNYQAIARDNSGNSINNTPLPVRITIQSDSLAGSTFWIEEHTSVTTNAFGLFTLIIGKGSRQSSSTVATFNDIDWRVNPKFIVTEIYYQSAWKNMGSSRLWSVPYSQVSGGLSGSLKKLAVRGDAISPDSALFEVKNSTGQTVFAVYNEGIRMYVDNGVAKNGTKGGFAIGGFETAKAPGQEYFRVTRDSTRVYVNQAAKGATKGGFAIGGFDVVKGSVNNFLDLTPNNYFIGQGAGKSNTTGLYNSFMGYQNGYLNTIGSRNIFLGYRSGYSNTEGESNIFQGYLAGNMNTTGSWNVFLGTYSGYRNKTGYSDIFIGNMAGYFCNAPENIFIGEQSGGADTSGILNVMIGNFTGANTTNGSNNTYLGYGASRMNQTGSNNLSLGSFTGYNNLGNNNTLLGTNAGYNNISGSGNVFLGYQSGYNETGSNQLYIENSQAGPATALIYGDFGTNYLRLNATTDITGNVAIGKTTPVTKLDIAGGNWNVSGGEGDFRIGDGTYRFKIGVSNAGSGAGDVRLNAHGGTNRLILGGGGADILLVTNTNVMPWYDNYSTLGASGYRWSAVYAVNGTIQTSDARLKTNIREIGYGLETILKLNPVTFTWKDDTQNIPRLGLIAQDVQKVIGEVVDTGTDQYQTLGINYSEIVPVLIKGIQEQQSGIESVKHENSQLKSTNESLLLQLRALENRMGQIESIFKNNGGK